MPFFAADVVGQPHLFHSPFGGAPPNQIVLSSLVKRRRCFLWRPHLPGVIFHAYLFVKKNRDPADPADGFEVLLRCFPEDAAAIEEARLSFLKAALAESADCHPPTPETDP